MVIGQENKFRQVTVNSLSVGPQSLKVPTLSIIIPTYNNAYFLPDALDSVFAQNFPSLEIIVIDDGSTDETQTILTEYSAQIRYLYQTNAGSAVARNTGLQLARGKYIVFLDADDVLLPGKLVEQVQVLEKRPSLGLVHSGWQIIDESGHVLRNVEPWHEIPELDLGAWVWHKPAFMGAMMFRRSMLMQVDGFDAELRQSQDVDLLLRLGLAGCTAAWLHRPTYQYRIHAQSTIRQNATAQHHYLMRVLDKFFADPRVPAHLMRDEREIRYYSLRWIAWHFVETGNLADISQPLQDAWHHSSYSPCETVLDWIVFFARSFDLAKRPLSTFPELWPHFASIVELDESWPVIERLLNWWLSHSKLNVIDESETKQFLVEIWGGWLTAVSAETTLTISAEMIIDWCLWFEQGVMSGKLDITKSERFQTLTSAQVFSLSQWTIVQKPENFTGTGLVTTWQNLVQLGLISPAESHLVVRVLLTLFGQLMLRRHWPEAINTLWLAFRRSITSPRTIVHWWVFMKTAVSYLIQSNRDSETIANGLDLATVNNKETRS